MSTVAARLDTSCVLRHQSPEPTESEPARTAHLSRRAALNWRSRAARARAASA